MHITTDGTKIEHPLQEYASSFFIVTASTSKPLPFPSRKMIHSPHSRAGQLSGYQNQAPLHQLLLTITPANMNAN
jgi:hypothetical protein